MFDIGFSEMVLLAAIALVAIGPKQLPEVARVVGRMINEFKRAASDVTRTIVDTRETTNRLVSDARKSMFDAAVSPKDGAQQNAAAIGADPSVTQTEYNAEDPYGDRPYEHHDGTSQEPEQPTLFADDPGSGGAASSEAPQDGDSDRQMSLNLEPPAHSVPRKES